MFSTSKLLLPNEYVDDLVKQISHAKKRINIVALVVSEDNRTKEIIDALYAASQRGVAISIGMDLYFTYKELGKASSKWSYVRAQLKKMRKTKKRLEDAGISVRWLGQFGFTFFSHRTHLKWSIIDDVTYTFGGINLYDIGLSNNDMMFKFKDTRLAERMSAEHELVISTDKANRVYPSHTFSMSVGTILVDGGRMFDSIIYRRACELTQKAEKVVFVSQYCPTGKLAELLKDNQAACYFNDWRNAHVFTDRLLIWLSVLRYNIKTKYTHKKYLHAKFMLFYLPNNKVVALTGSHNFVASGGKLGTREVALETRDPKIVRQLELFFKNHVA